MDKNVLEYTTPVDKKTAKGVNRKGKDDHLHFAHYLNVLRSFKSYVCKQNLISSTNHTVRTVHTRKIELTAFDTKRCCARIQFILTCMVVRIQCQIEWIFFQV